MASKYLQNFPVPHGFQEVLADFTQEVLREQPANIIEFAAIYFEGLEKGKKNDGSSRNIAGVSGRYLFSDLEMQRKWRRKQQTLQPISRRRVGEMMWLALLIIQIKWRKRGRIRSMIGLVDLENFADLEDDGGFEDEMGLVVQNFEHDGGGPGFDQSQLRVWIFSDDVPVLETEEVDDFWM